MSYRYIGVNYIDHHRDGDFTSGDFAYQYFVLYSPNRIGRRPTEITLIIDKHKIFVLDNEKEI